VVCCALLHLHCHSLLHRRCQSKSDSDVLNYGDPFQLATNPSLRWDKKTGYVSRVCVRCSLLLVAVVPLTKLPFPQPFLLESQPVSAFGSSGAGAAQNVQLSPLPSANTVWTVVAANGNRLATDGTPVPANAAVALYHRATNVALAATLDSRVATSFGPELAVCCRTIKSTGRGAGGAALPGNRWVFVTASDPSAAVDRRDFIELTPEVLVSKVKATIMERGSYGFRGLSRSFRIMDDRGDGNVDREDFKWGLRDYGVMLTDEEFDVVMDAFDRDGNGLISLTEFLAALRGELNDTRKEVVGRAFAKLDRDGSGQVTLEDLRGVYSTEFHPGVKEGKLDEDAALAEFLENWDVSEADGIVTKSEFETYYGDLSASIDSDEYFVLMVTRAWRLEE